MKSSAVSESDTPAQTPDAEVPLKNSHPRGGPSKSGVKPRNDLLTVEVCCPSLNRPTELTRLRKSLPADCLFTPSLETKPRALTQIVNELFLRSTADIVVMAADHLEFRPGCIDAVREIFRHQFPDLDGVVGLNICNLPHIINVSEYCFVAVGRRFIQRFYVQGQYQGVFCPEYYHFYGDTEFGLFADKAGKFFYDERAAVFTWHPNAGNAPRDGTYSASRSRKAYDDAVWKRRRSANLLWGETFEKRVAPSVTEPTNPTAPSTNAEVEQRPNTPRISMPFGARHAEKIMTFLQPGSRVLHWGAPDTSAWLTANMPEEAVLTSIEDGPSTATDSTPAPRVGQPSQTSLQLTDRGEYDLIVIDDCARPTALRQAKTLLSSNGVVVLRGAQRVCHDEAKASFTSHGHMGPCLGDASHLWWAGRSELVGNPRSSGALPLIISFYTKKTDYEAEARKLMDSCQRSNLEHLIVGVDSRGSWEANCSLKSEFIYEIWKSSKRPVLWVDSDAILHRPPALLRGCTADFAVHKCRGWQFASGTVFFNQTAGAAMLLTRWLARCRRYPRLWDQDTLDLAWEDTVATEALETLWLPEPYCRIFDLYEGRSSSEGVIEHFQASRRFKAKVSKGPNTPPITHSSTLIEARRASRLRSWQLAPADAGDTRLETGGNGGLSITTLPAAMVDIFVNSQPVPARVLCLTGGVNAFWRLLEERGYEVHGIAATSEYAKEAKQFCGERIQVGTPAKLPFTDGFFDAVVSYGTLELLEEPDLDKTLRELRRVAKERICLFVQPTPDPEDRWPTTLQRTGWWKSKLAKEGFTLSPATGCADPFGSMHILTFIHCKEREKTTGNARISDEMAAFVSQVAEFFSSNDLLQIDWPAGAPPRYVRHAPGNLRPESCELPIANQFPSLPFQDGSCDTVFNLGSLSTVPEEVLGDWLTELCRITGRNVWIAIDATPDRDQVWWEKRVIEAGFRKHPLMARIVPFAAEDRDDAHVMLVLEKIPPAALAQYPLAALRAERDLHMDMLRETGVRSEAHLARYQLAATYAKNGDVILDAACGLGYGSAMLARQFPQARVIGVDNSEYAIAYALKNFATVLPNLEFHLADACDLQMVGDDSVDLVVSFETIEHVRKPDILVGGFARRLKPGALLIGSVPNLWLDETGRDPNPWHFHVFDLPKFCQLLGGHLALADVYRQNAGGWLRNPKSLPVLRPVQLPVTDQLDAAEWWIIAARKSPAAAHLSTGRRRPRVWLIDGEQRGQFYASLRRTLDCDWICGRDTIPADIVDIAIVSDEWWWQNSLAVQEMKRRGVPTLHVMDGVIDWKNTWENPRSLSEKAGLPLFQPVLADKIACLGRSQARVLSAWGGGAKCEIVGMPRFDQYCALKRRSRSPDAKPRVLIMTANTPYFDEKQHDDIRRALGDLKAHFTSAAALAIEAVWRLTGGLEREIDVESNATEFTGVELAAVLTTVDAVICSSSTAMLEAMLLGLPTALLDYSNVPHYIQPSWQITAPTQIATVIAELLKPAEAKVLHQEMVLHDALECRSPAGPRLAGLVTSMIELGRQARARGDRPVFPDRMVPTDGLPTTENRFHLPSLYPGHSVFRVNRLTELQAELGHWRKRAGL